MDMYTIFRDIVYTKKESHWRRVEEYEETIDSEMDIACHSPLFSPDASLWSRGEGFRNNR